MSRVKDYNHRNIVMSSEGAVRYSDGTEEPS